MTIGERLARLEMENKVLKDRLDNLVKHTSSSRIKPETRTPQEDFGAQVIVPSTGTGLGKLPGGQGHIIFNNSDIYRITWGNQPPTPTKGYNKHSHSRYAGGALDIHTLELVEYITDDPEIEDPIILDPNGDPVNKHCQAFWKNQPEIVKDGDIEKIGKLDIAFDSYSKKWVAGGKYIDVENTYMVQYEWIKDDEIVPEGTKGATKRIKLDDNGKEMSSPLLYTKGNPQTVAGKNENLNKSNVYWDRDAQCWRFYAVFKPYPIEEE